MSNVNKPSHVHFWQQIQKSCSNVFQQATLMRLIISWIGVFVFMYWRNSFLQQPLSSALAFGIFIILFCLILWTVFGVVREADYLAEALDEPYSTLILTLSIVLIEVILIASILMGPSQNPTIGKDAIFSVMMIILNLVVGLDLSYYW